MFYNPKYYVIIIILNHDPIKNIFSANFNLIIFKKEKLRDYRK